MTVDLIDSAQKGQAIAVGGGILHKTGVIRRDGGITIWERDYRDFFPERHF